MYVCQRALINFRQCQIVGNAALAEALQLRFLTHLSAFSVVPDGERTGGRKPDRRSDLTTGSNNTDKLLRRYCIRVVSRLSDRPGIARFRARIMADDSADFRKSDALVDRSIARRRVHIYTIFFL